MSEYQYYGFTFIMLWMYVAAPLSLAYLCYKRLRMYLYYFVEGRQDSKRYFTWLWRAHAYDKILTAYCVLSIAAVYFAERMSSDLHEQVIFCPFLIPAVAALLSLCERDSAQAAWRKAILKGDPDYLDKKPAALTQYERMILIFSFILAAFIGMLCVYMKLYLSGLIILMQALPFLPVISYKILVMANK